MTAKYHPTRKILAMSTVYQNGKTQIPSDVRQTLQIKDGDKLLWVSDEGKIVVESA
jgi:AbrB family looped-hinge helix DNA binding protein